MNSWEWKLESWAIAACVAAGILPPTLQLRHHDDKDPAANDRVFFLAVTEQNDPPGTPVYETQLTVEYRTTNRDAAVTDPIFEDIIAVFSNPGALDYAALLFPGGLWYDQESSDDNRTDGRDTRERNRSFDFRLAQSGDPTDFQFISDPAGTVVTDGNGFYIISAP